MARWWALALAAMLVAGCTAKPATDETMDPVAPEERAREALLPPGAATTATSKAPEANPRFEGNDTQVVIPIAAPEVDTTTAPWWFLSTEATPKGSATGYIWTVPEGALLPYESYEEWDVLPFEMGVVRGDGTGVTGYVVSFFLLQGEGAVHLYTLAGVPVEGVLRTTPVLEEPLAGEVSFDPRFVRFVGDDLDAGDRLGIVFAGFGKGDLGLAFRVLDHDPDYDEDPAEDEEEMLADFQDLGQGLALVPAGRAEATHVNIHEEFNYGVTTVGVGLYGVEMRAGDIQVRDDLPTSDLRPLVTLRQVTLSSAPEPEEGFGFVTGIYLGSSGAAQYEVLADIYGEKLETNGVTAGAYLLGYFAFSTVADGTGGSKTDFHLDAVDSNDLQLLALIDYGYSATLETLLGVAAKDDSSSYSLLPVGLAADPRRLETPLGPFELALEM